MYIFEPIDMINYNVTLDTYTIEDETFNTTYDKSEPYKKVQMNIDKFFQMINRHDYITSYNCLAGSFKNRSVKTEQDFINTAKKSFYTYNKVSYISIDELGNNTYSYKIKLFDLTGKNVKEKNVTIVMQLLEDRNFVMSFSIE